MRARSIAALLTLGLCACSRSGLDEPSLRYPCLALDPRGPSQRDVAATVQIAQADVLFLVDNSSSMADEIDRIREQLRDVLAPQIRMRMPDSDLGLATFSDFGERAVGEMSHPYLLLQPMTSDVDAVRAATSQIKLEYGGDDPESQLEALYQAATGEGLGIYIKPKKDCPFGTHGGVCFRDGAFAIVLLFTDAPFRGVAGLRSDGSLAPETAYNPDAPGAPYIPYLRTYDETIRVLTQNNIHVVGLWSGDQEDIGDIRRVVRDSGSVDAQGDPIVFDIGSDGRNLGQGVISTIETLTSSLRIGVYVKLDDANPDDGLDPRTLVTGVRALSSDPADGARAAGDHFENVQQGTRVVFELDFDTSKVPAAKMDRRYPLGVRIEADDGTEVFSETVDVVVQAQTECNAKTTTLTQTN